MSKLLAGAMDDSVSFDYTPRKLIRKMHDAMPVSSTPMNRTRTYKRNPSRISGPGQETPRAMLKKIESEKATRKSSLYVDKTYRDHSRKSFAKSHSSSLQDNSEKSRLYTSISDVSTVALPTHDGSLNSTFDELMGNPLLIGRKRKANISKVDSHSLSRDLSPEPTLFSSPQSSKHITDKSKSKQLLIGRKRKANISKHSLSQNASKEATRLANRSPEETDEEVAKPLLSDRKRRESIAKNLSQKTAEESSSNNTNYEVDDLLHTPLSKRLNRNESMLKNNLSQNLLIEATPEKSFSNNKSDKRALLSIGHKRNENLLSDSNNVSREITPEVLFSNSKKNVSFEGKFLTIGSKRKVDLTRNDNSLNVSKDVTPETSFSTHQKNVSHERRSSHSHKRKANLERDSDKQNESREASPEASISTKKKNVSHERRSLSLSHKKVNLERGDDSQSELREASPEASISTKKKNVSHEHRSLSLAHKHKANLERDSDNQNESREASPEASISTKKKNVSHERRSLSLSHKKANLERDSDSQNESRDASPQVSISAKKKIVSHDRRSLSHSHKTNVERDSDGQNESTETSFSTKKKIVSNKRTSLHKENLERDQSESRKATPEASFSSKRNVSDKRISLSHSHVSKANLERDSVNQNVSREVSPEASFSTKKKNVTLEHTLLSHYYKRKANLERDSLNVSREATPKAKLPKSPSSNREVIDELLQTPLSSGQRMKRNILEQNFDKEVSPEVALANKSGSSRTLHNNSKIDELVGTPLQAKKRRKLNLSQQKDISDDELNHSNESISASKNESGNSPRKIVNLSKRMSGPLRNSASKSSVSELQRKIIPPRTLDPEDLADSMPQPEPNTSRSRRDDERDDPLPDIDEDAVLNHKSSSLKGKKAAQNSYSDPIGPSTSSGKTPHSQKTINQFFSNKSKSVADKSVIRNKLSQSKIVMEEDFVSDSVNEEDDDEDPREVLQSSWLKNKKPHPGLKMFLEGLEEVSSISSGVSPRRSLKRKSSEAKRLQSVRENEKSDDDDDEGEVEEQEADVAPDDDESLNGQLFDHDNDEPEKPKTVKTKKISSDRVPRLNSNSTRELFQHFAGMQMRPEAMELLNHCIDSFWELTIDTLSVYAKHAGRSTINKSDIDLYLLRARYAHDRQSLNALVERYLPLELREIVLPMARAKTSTYDL